MTWSGRRCAAVVMGRIVAGGVERRKDGEKPAIMTAV